MLSQNSVNEHSISEKIEQAQSALSNRKTAEVYTLLRDVPIESTFYRKSLEILGFAANAEKDWTAASAYWAKLSTFNPNRLGPIRQAVSAFIAKGDFQGGLEFIDPFLQKSDNIEALQVERMRLLSKLGRQQDIEEIYDDVRSFLLKTRDNTATIQLARWCLSNGRSSDAIELFERIKEFDPDKVDALFYLGRVYYGERNYQKSKASWVELENHPKIAKHQEYEPQIFLARIALAENDQKAAIHHLSMAMEKDPRRVEPYRSLANIQLREKNLVKAKEISDSYLEAFPDHLDSWMLKISLAESSNDFTEADLTWKQVFEKFGYAQMAARKYSLYLEKQGRSKELLSFWETVESVEGASDVSQFKRAEVLRILDRHEEALNILEKDLRPLERRHKEGIMMQSTLLREVGRRADAGELNESATSLFPVVSSFWIGAVKHARDIDSLEKISSLLEKAKTVYDPETTTGALALARIYTAAEQYENASAHYDKLLKIDPENDNGRLALMRMLVSKGRFREAEPHAKYLKSKNRRNTEATKVMARMARFRRLNLTTENNQPVSFSIIKHIANSSPITKVRDSARSVAIFTSSLGSGGAERQVAYTAVGLKIDHNIEKLTVVGQNLNPKTSRDFFRQEILNTEHEVVDIASEGSTKLIREVASRFPDSRDDISLLQSLPPEEALVSTSYYAWLRLNPTDIVHTWQDSVNIAGGLAAVLAGVPKIVLATRSTRPDSRRRMRSTLEPGYKALLSRPGISILNNSINGARDYENWLGLEDGRITTLHNGMDVKNMRKRANPRAVREVRSELGFPEDALVLGGVMRFTEEKRPELFIQVAMNAARRDPRLHFVLIGAGPMRAGLMEEVELAGLSSQIIFPGRQNPVEPWMASFDMLFLSSRMEGLPNVLLEAQCVGTPVATMKVGGAPETLVDGETGILIDETNPDIIASIILEKLYDKKWRSQASIKGRKRIEEFFSIEAMAEKTRSLYLS